ncbi:MAG: PAAR-like protein [Rhodothermales bacterium]
MPGFLLHQGATVLCLHGGQAQATAPSPRVLVGNQPVVTQSAPHTVAGCPFVSGSNPMPCVTAQWVTAATRVLVGGVPVLLQDSQAVCVPNGTGVTIAVTQVRVKAI